MDFDPNDEGEIGDIECSVEIYYLYKEVKFISDDDLIQHAVHLSIDLGVSEQCESAIHDFFNKGVLTPSQRGELENFFVVTNSNFSLGEDGGIYRTTIHFK